jgi:hypothetical protein
MYTYTSLHINVYLYLTPLEKEVEDRGGGRGRREKNESLLCVASSSDHYEINLSFTPILYPPVEWITCVRR